MGKSFNQYLEVKSNLDDMRKAMDTYKIVKETFLKTKDPLEETKKNLSVQLVESSRYA